MTPEPPAAPAVLTADEYAYITAAAHAAATDALTRVWEHRAQRHHAAYTEWTATVPAPERPARRAGVALFILALCVAACAAYVTTVQVWSR